MNPKLIWYAVSILALSNGTPKAETASVWDPSCKTIERAYAVTRSMDFYSTKFYALKSRGGQELMQELRFSGDGYFSRFTAPKVDGWIKSPRPGWTLWSNGGPKFSACSLAEDSEKGPAGSHYRAKWSRHPYSADVEIWLSHDNTRVAKVVSRDTGKVRLFEFPALLEEFDFAPERAAPPSVYKIDGFEAAE